MHGDGRPNNLISREQREAGFQQREEVNLLLRGDPRVARDQLRNAIVALWDQAASVKKLIHDERASDYHYAADSLEAMIFDGEDFGLAAARSTASLINIQLNELLTGLGKVAIVLNPPYFAQTFPPALLAFTTNPTNLWDPHAGFREQTLHTIGCVDAAVFRSGNDDQIGLRLNAPNGLKNYDDVAEAATAALRIGKQWEVVSSEINRLDPSLSTQNARAYLSGLTIRFERAANHTRDIIKATVIPKAGPKREITHPYIDEDTAWDGRRTLEQTASWHAELAFDVLRCVGFSPDAASLLTERSIGQARQPVGFSLVIDDVDSILGNHNKKIEISGEKFADWISRCDLAIGQHYPAKAVQLQLPAISIGALATPEGHEFY